MIQYEPEELLAVVAQLTEEYTGGKSTSVTYERANYLMEAVLYCLREYEESGLKEEPCVLSKEASVAGCPAAVEEAVTAQTAFRLGREAVWRKVQQAKTQYAQLLEGFCAYGNENYNDTVVKAIPGFFQAYDFRFAPQETIITMDYPVLFPMNGMAGIDAVSVYMDCIRTEQLFLGAFAPEYVVRVLRCYRKDYRKHFFNLCSVMLRHALGRLPGVAANAARPDRLKGILEAGVEALADRIGRGGTMTGKPGQEELCRLKEYLELDLDNFVTDLRVASENNFLDKALISLDDI